MNNLVVGWEYGSSGSGNKAGTWSECILEIVALITYHVKSSTEVNYCFLDKV